jgi:tRNA-Thr(GGU) m(6)t(6)A37 methyltransferase TsaA
MTLKTIGIIHSSFQKCSETPIQSSASKNSQGSVEIFPEYIEGLRDLDGFDRIWLLYWFDRSMASNLVVTPYLDKKEHGIFATRAPARPNPIGLSCVKLKAVKENLLIIEDLDILDKTPLLDIKPYVSVFDHFEVKRNGWVENKSVDGKYADDRFLA